MGHQRIPAHWTVQRATKFFAKDNVPPALVTRHNTAKGVFGQLCVMEGTVTYFGFADAEATEPETKIVINAGEFGTSPPEYWHKIELSDNAQFNLVFWAETDKSKEALFGAKENFHAKS